MTMKNPVHPGAIVREDCLKPLGLSVTEGAKRLGVGRQTPDAFQSGEREGVPVHRDGLPAVESVRFHPGDTAWHATRLRPRTLARAGADD